MSASGSYPKNFLIWMAKFRHPKIDNQGIYYSYRLLWLLIDFQCFEQLTSCS